MSLQLTIDANSLIIEPRGSWVLLEKIEVGMGSGLLLPGSTSDEIKLFRVRGISHDPVFSMAGEERPHAPIKVGDYVIPSTAKGVELPGVSNVFLCQEHDIIMTVRGVQERETDAPEE